MTSPEPAAVRFHTSTVRRVVGALAALALAGGLAAGPALPAAARSSTPRTASPSTATPGEVLAGDVRRLQASLTPRQRAALRGGDPHIAGTGLRLGDLGTAQRDLAERLLPTLLSPAAWAEIVDLLASDAARGALDEYHLALFGDVDADFALQISTPDLLLIAVRQGDELEISPDLVA